MFPQVRVPTQGELYDDSDAAAELPDQMRVMDLQQSSSRAAWATATG